MNLIILGVTGNIGLQTLDIVRNSLEKYKIISITANHSIDKMRNIIQEFHPLFVSMGEKRYIDTLKQEFPNVKFGFGEQGLVDAVKVCSDDETIVINSLVGSVGLVPTIEAIKVKRNIALANKETLVIGGELIKPLLKEFNVTLLPIDSEHSAIMQCLNGEDNKYIKKIIITASGGSFRDLSRKDLEKVTVTDALKHPNWNMGAKITIDSATMMNKGFEVIEAHYLFDVEYDKIETILHKESIIHSMVEFTDSSVIAQLGNPDMRMTINYALNYPKRDGYVGESLDLVKLSAIHFSEMDYKQFPLLKIAIDAGISKGLNPTTLNAANEAAVQLFLKGKITFLEIEDIIIDCLNHFKNDLNIDLNKILSRDLQVKDYVYLKHS
ncbi:MAG: 1-deoxy-D-xylulose-5-phosphate reductoisomerase [Candidatus Izemoplasma sp.]